MAAIVDPFFGTNNDPVFAARQAQAVTTSDTADLTHVTSSIYVGGTGDLTVIMANDQTATSPVTFKAVPVGTMLNLQVRRIMATNTTATLIVALWS